MQVKIQMVNGITSMPTSAFTPHGSRLTRMIISGNHAQINHGKPSTVSQNAK